MVERGDRLNYSNDMEKSVDFIEAHIQGELTAKMVANHVGYSLYHYCRIFLACHGISVMEYVRKRRLSLAAHALLNGQKVIDVAIEYGFETPSGFSKAFRREYGFAPTQYISHMKMARSYISNEKTTLQTGGLLMKPVIVKKTAIKVAGYAIKTTISGATHTKDVAALWHQFDTNGWEDKLYTQLTPPKHGEVGIFVPGEDDTVSYILGVVVDNFNAVTDDMVCVEIPEATYAVFTTPPVDVTRGDGEGKANTVDFPKAIKATWKYIFVEWFKDSGYEYDQSKLDFEYYDERCHFRKDTVMDIYIPVIQK